MQSYLPRILTVLVTASCVGCSILAPANCTLNVEPGINVRVQDAATGAPTATNARLVVTDGAYTDSSYVTLRDDSATLSAAPERAGVYTVMVRKAGYVTWTRSGVEVTKGTCHVQPANLTAALTKG